MKFRRFISPLAYHPAFRGRYIFQEFAVAVPDDAPDPDRHPYHPHLIPVREQPAPAAPQRPTTAPAPQARTPDAARERPRASRTQAEPRVPGRVLRWLPEAFQRLYLGWRSLAGYARSTRVRPIPPPAITPELRERQFRVEIIQDAFCAQRPKPGTLFSKPDGDRGMFAWCESKRGHRCENCERARTLHAEAVRGDADAEAALHRWGTRAARRLLAQRRAWAETQRQRRLARAENGAPVDPKIFLALGWAPWRARRVVPWYIQERRNAEATLLRDGKSRLRAALQRRRLRLRDAALVRERAATGATPARETRRSATRALSTQPADAPKADAPEASPIEALAPERTDTQPIAELTSVAEPVNATPPAAQPAPANIAIQQRSRGPPQAA